MGVERRLFLFLIKTVISIVGETLVYDKNVSFFRLSKYSLCLLKIIINHKIIYLYDFILLLIYIINKFQGSLINQYGNVVALH